MLWKWIFQLILIPDLSDLSLKGVWASLRDCGALAAALDLHRGPRGSLPRGAHPVCPARLWGGPGPQDARAGREGGIAGQRDVTIRK